MSLPFLCQCRPCCLPQPLPRGHLLNYPNHVLPDGTITPLPDCDEIPDLGGKILGTKSKTLPGNLTA